MPEADMSPVAAAETALTIVHAQKKETLSHIIMLAHRIWPDAYEGMMEPQQTQNILLSIYTYENLQKEMAEGHQHYVGYIDNIPVGYSSAYLEDDVIWLKKLYIDKAHTGKRLGVRLMHAAVAAFLPAAEIRLLANEKNIPAHNFYTHVGFHKIGETPVQMGDYEFTDFIFSMPLTD